MQTQSFGGMPSIGMVSTNKKKNITENPHPSSQYERAGSNYQPNIPVNPYVQMTAINSTTASATDATDAGTIQFSGTRN